MNDGYNSRSELEAEFEIAVGNLEVILQDEESREYLDKGFEIEKKESRESTGYYLMFLQQVVEKASKDREHQVPGLRMQLSDRRGSPRGRPCIAYGKEDSLEP